MASVCSRDDREGSLTPRYVVRTSYPSDHAGRTPAFTNGRREGERRGHPASTVLIPGQQTAL